MIYFDGACEDVNPGGHMGWGVAVVDEGTGAVQMTSSGYQEAGPETSNNVAEYLGCGMALRKAIAAAKAGAESFTIRGDSKLETWVCGFARVELQRRRRREACRQFRLDRSCDARRGVVAGLGSEGPFAVVAAPNKVRRPQVAAAGQVLEHVPGDRSALQPVDAAIPERRKG